MILDGLPARTTLTKGHGTENDFVIVPDPDGTLEIAPSRVAALCDRRAGIGADGVLRVVRTARMPGYEDQAAEAEFFMDYRNADGSVAEMCGNGVRVFALFVTARGLVKGGGVGEPVEFAVGTRGGIKRVTLRATGENTADVTVDMGIPVFPTERGAVTVDVHGTPRDAVDVDMGNPHAVVFVDSTDDAGSLYEMPTVSPTGVYAEGVNVEFAADVAPRHLAMRVYERGVGETRSCGTGACAVMIAAARRDAADAGTEYTVDVLGGRLRFVERADGHLEMTGPAALVFDIMESR
ncbi:diaminopimelate epimerase [Catenulispora acidiphila DSM 44928]|uniref:Diaminopimelate epimerase n=1 Tax=Catenulispora acidiphila (strain DSM 44928 / JCM 14897 / NBRC 102108 / NRRL B-24433 / ID139908) TaxID=479433 RepID=C7QBG7_CATAD|nr:diaminopimelate epimerase [Catenulispora acidiphila]ACU70544.1 diaminopimelate epimerase [Catenulispora acidiphila DSM 44928]